MATTVTQELQDGLPGRDLQEPGDHAPRDQGLGRGRRILHPEGVLPPPAARRPAAQGP